MTRVFALFGGALVLVVGSRALGACDEETSHLLVGRLFESARGCLDPQDRIALVSGPAPSGTCPPTCVVGPSGRNGGATSVYVTTMCGPYPALDDTTGDPAGCSEALTAFDRGDTCLIDGDSSAPVAPPLDDAGGDGSLSADTGTDAKHD